MTCALCHRHLSNPSSIRQGMGRVCRARERKAPWLFDEQEIAPVAHGTTAVVTRGRDGALHFLPGSVK